MLSDGITFGACVPVEYAPAFADAGWDFIEALVDDLLAPRIPDDRWDGPRQKAAAPLPIRAANRLLPADLKVTGPDVSLPRLKSHMECVTRRAPQLGIEVLVFGSGQARRVPDGFNRDTARGQILQFCEMAGELCATAGVVLVAEPLNRHECNIINSVSEAMTYVDKVAHPAFRCLVDSFHLWLEHEPLEHVARAMPSIHHVHLADVKERAAPGTTGADNYQPLFAILQQARYHGMITVESTRLEDEPDGARRTLEFLKQQWNAAREFVGTSARRQM